jgi:hypothetical protein
MMIVGAMGGIVDDFDVSICFKIKSVKDHKTMDQKCFGGSYREMDGEFDLPKMWVKFFRYCFREQKYYYDYERL